jgi:hypothetical protein
MIRGVFLTAGFALATAMGLAAVETSGKRAVHLGHVPQAIFQAIAAADPGFRAAAAEYEVRDGKVYYDVEGTSAGGDEVEFDVTQVEGRWTIVETQRDIELAKAPAEVRAGLQAAFPDFTPRRIIESDQGDGVVIYEFFGIAGDAPETKIEVRYEAGEARVLEEEWLH